MVGIMISIAVFNSIAYKWNKTLTMNQILHIWMFTIALQSSFDVMVEFKYHGYWYFKKEADWIGLMSHLFIVPPINVIFLNTINIIKTKKKKIIFFILFMLFIMIYELFTLLPEPWGFFSYGWWKFYYTVILDPILLFILLGYYHLLLKIEKK